MASKPAKKEPYQYIGNEIWEQGHPTGRYQYENNPKWKFTGSGTMFDSKAAAEAAWNTFSSAWDKCSRDAEMIRFCTEVELEVAAVYGMVQGVQESYSFTDGNLQSAYAQTTADNALSEANIEYVNSQITALSEVFQNELTNTINPSVESLNTINENIKTVGQALTNNHKTLYKMYKNSCEQVGVEIQNFYVEAEK